jgi:hypothetical protein
MKIKRQVLINGRPAAEMAGKRGAEYFSPDTKRPMKIFGVPVVGQWNDKFIRPGWRDRIEENPDPATWITEEDYLAWLNAFHEVYSAS